MSRVLVQSVVVASIAGLAAGSTEARAASAFDGSWTVNESCPPSGSDVRGYAWSYPAAVRNGTLSAQYQAPGGGGSIRLQGRIGADGRATLSAAGTTGQSDYAVGHVARGTPYHFHVDAQFGGSSGSGRRIEQRACDFTFSRG